MDQGLNTENKEKISKHSSLDPKSIMIKAQVLLARVYGGFLTLIPKKVTFFIFYENSLLTEKYFCFTLKVSVKSG